MKIYFKILVAYFLLAFLSISILMAQPRKIDDIISKKASQKLYYQLALAAIYQKDLENNKLKSTQAISQYKQRLRSMSNSIAINPDENEPSVNVLIKISKGSLINASYFIDHKRIEGEKFSYITANIKVKNIEEIGELENVLAIEPSFKTELALDESAKNIHADDVWSGFSNTPLPDKITGEGVFVGIIDTKPNIVHRTFVDDQKKSRFIPLNDFLKYDYAAWGMEIDKQAHGTHVAGIAAGKGIEGVIGKGIAYKSKLLWYPMNTKTETNNILLAIEAMKLAAGNYPLVINHSVGIFTGPRDGSLLIEETLNDKIFENLVFVNAAGNQSTRFKKDCGFLFAEEFVYPLHFRGEVGNNPNNYLEIKFRVRKETSCLNELQDNSSFNIEIWHENDIVVRVVDNDEFSAPEISDPAGPGDELPPFKFDNNSDDEIGIYNLNNGVSKSYDIHRPNSTNSKVVLITFRSEDKSFSSGEYIIRICPKTENDAGLIDAYLCEPNIVKGGFVDGDDFYNVASPGLASEVICVASHRKSSAHGGISGFSSLGPMRNDMNGQVSKPDIAAPGDSIISADYQNINGYKILSGTSMAAPHVTGAIALLMQCFPQLNAIQVKKILQKSAGPIPTRDGGLKKVTESEDRKYWGAGKLDILAAYKSMAGFSYEDSINLKYKDRFELNVNAGLPFGPVNYNWNNNSNHSYQKFTNGAIFSNSQENQAHWLGEGIWSKWINMDATQSRLGLPLSSEFEDTQNNSYATVTFENGKIYWDGAEAKVEYFVQPNLTAAITEGAAPLAVQFTNLTRVDVGTVTSWLWDFGDGSTSTEQAPSHTFTTVGSFDVKLTIEYNSKSFQITVVDFITTFSTPSTTNIIRMEYFFDTDPGLGNAIPITITPSPYINIAPKLGLADVSPGLHRLYIRTCDSNRKWSTIYSKPILVTTEQAGTTITKMEYFFDEKPQTGIGIPLSFTAAKDVSVSKNLSMANVAPGLHRIYFRAQDKAGRWSTIHSKPILITNEKSLASIKKIEYFFDEPTDGVSASTLSFTPSTDVTVSQQISTSGIATGLHRLYFKAQDETGRWSALHSKPVLINNSSNLLPNISHLEYFIDADPGLNSGISLPFTSSPDVTVNSNIALDTISIGSHNIYFRAKDSNGRWSLPQFSTFTIEKNSADFNFNTGWNIFSSYITPDNIDLKAIFQPLIDAGSLKKVMDESGKTIENFGAFGGWKNNIGNLNSAKGYKVNVTEASTLSLEGTPVSLPLDITLATGWNIISYPSATAQDAKALVQSLIDAGKLKKVMDESGKTIENFGAFGGWKNNIGNFMPGKGYKVNVTESCILTIPAEGQKSAIIVPELLSSTHFKTVFVGNGTDHTNIHLVNLQTSGLQAGDEIGVFDGELCVGSATVGAEQMMDGTISIPASANDDLEETVNGFSIGHAVDLQLYRGGQTYQLNIEKLSGSESFEKNGSLFARINANNLTTVQIIDYSSQFRCYPNPFTQEITIEVLNILESKLTVEIYNMTGQLIKSLFKGTNSSHLVLKWNGTNDSGQQVSPGGYFCKVNGQSKQLIFEGGKGKK